MNLSAGSKRLAKVLYTLRQRFDSANGALGQVRTGDTPGSNSSALSAELRALVSVVPRSGLDVSASSLTASFLGAPHAPCRDTPRVRSPVERRGGRSGGLEPSLRSCQEP